MPHRCYLPDLVPAAGKVEVDGDEAHHLIRVLRCKTGEAVECLNGRGGLATGTIARVERRRIALDLTDHQQVEVPEKQFTLIQATPKGKRQDIVLQKAVELGVHRIIFVQTEHVVARLGVGDEADKLQRWHQVMVGGLKQSGNPWLPALEFSFDWQAVVTRAQQAQDVVFLADLSPGARSLRTVLPEHAAANKMACCIGPEGDFSPEETALARGAGCLPVDFGSRVLRTETAALFVMSVFAYEFLN